MQAISKKPLFSAVPLEPGYRTRLIEGMLASVAEKGYTDVSVMDIVRHAKVSKRTFYEHFADKERCFIDAYSAISAELLGRVARGAAVGQTAEEKLALAISAYIGALEEHRPLIRAFLSDVHAAGPAALALRRTVLLRFAELLRMMVETVRLTREDVRSLSPEMAMTIIGGVHERLLLMMEKDHVDELKKVGETARELITSLLKLEEPPVVAAVPVPARRVRRA